MKVSLNWVKEYVDIPAEISDRQLAYDLTMRTVEVESVIDTAEKYHDIVVGRISEVKPHPNADKLRICIVDIGEEEPVQIVCGGSNLYEGENVVVSKPGSEVFWHGEQELVKIKPTKMRGVESYGMICGASEVFLDGFFPTEDPAVIVDLGDLECTPGQNIAEVVGMDDTVLDIDNKSLTNRPDLWGHYGIARELAAIYDLELRPLPEPEDLSSLPAYKVKIEEPEKCMRYDALEIENVSVKESPVWMKAALIKAGMRPINMIVDITNYVMLAVGQPTHAFDRTHVDGETIIVRNAKKGETLELLDGAELDLTEDDLVICDVDGPMGLAGIRGGKKDSILPETEGVVLEAADFAPETIRKTDKRFDEKTDAAIRYEKGIDTQRIDQGMALATRLFSELYPEAKFVAYSSVVKSSTQKAKIDVSKEFLDTRLGKVLTHDEISSLLRRLGFVVEFDGSVFHVAAPVWRSTGDVSMRDDVLGDIARLIGYENFEAKPLPVNFEHAVHQPGVDLERKIREYLAFRCGMNEIFTYPWVSDKFIGAAGIDTSGAVRLATPPAPDQAMLRQSLVPGMLESALKNLRYYDEFSIFEMAQVFEKGEYHESSEDETLPIQKKFITGAFVGSDAKKLFFKAKGVVEEMPRFCSMEGFSFKQKGKPAWADRDAWLNVVNKGGKIIGSLALVAVPVMADAGIRRASMAVFELDYDMMKALSSRTNEFVHIPQFPLVEEDLSLLVDEDVTWHEISEAIKFMVRELTFVEEYRGRQIPAGKKSIMLRFKMGNDDSTMTAKQIDKKRNAIIKALEKKCGAEIR
jgi:phenylalanyl-tRNA synthetase beta chain